MQALLQHKTFCPYCGESIELLIDSSVDEQEYVEDCQVCCRPVVVFAIIDGEQLRVELYQENA